MSAIEATQLKPPNVRTRDPRVADEQLGVPFSLRCGALLIDYIALASFVVVGTLIARMFGGGARSAGSSAEMIGILVAAAVTVLNLGLLAGFTGRTLGKWATGLRIERNSGGDIGIGRAFLRHFIGYPISFLLLGMGFLLATLTVRGRGLHDIIADTIVVREGSLPRPNR